MKRLLTSTILVLSFIAIFLPGTSASAREHVALNTGVTEEPFTISIVQLAADDSQKCHADC